MFDNKGLTQQELAEIKKKAEQDLNDILEDFDNDLDNLPPEEGGVLIGRAKKDEKD